ncbi:hypothetical protein [Pseudodesulfovibrio senegalensis]|uniref:Uncharacterized protein n=1 Tax=Pseudodesulfovibrio senegalensis TaxID=1721087 RepID=A0A6N6MYW6_9BACT|nr:hypothetical protein [Pseudodesulfovibrio senegalensis]KAB1440767.1 hypothetical protein F8A88_12510 [Pseudodesulfovibrio senegalensis]
MKTFKTIGMFCMALLLATAIMAPLANADDQQAKQEEITAACEAQCSGDAECVKACVEQMQAQDKAAADSKEGEEKK